MQAEVKGGHFMLKKHVAARLSCHPETVGRMVRLGRFPAPIKFSEGGACRWPEHVVDEWVRAQLEKVGIKPRVEHAAAAR